LTLGAPKQLPLALMHDPQYGREEFVIGPSNVAALRLIESWPAWPAPIVVLSGPRGSGKTHLAHIWSDRAGAEIAPAVAIDDPVSALHLRRALAVEDIDGQRVSEHALFHLINQVVEREATLLLTSRSAAEDWAVGLPDLRSRLRLATPAALGAPDDELLRQVLVKLFADRQLIVDKPVIDYLLLRMERSLSAAVALVEALDRTALAEARRITRPMAAQILSGNDVAFADRQ
jgi:chromosomal replication initiation ATPase DnaA